MYSIEKLLEMIASENSSIRYDACEWLRISQESSPKVINALEKATHDTDLEVAMRAYCASLPWVLFFTPLIIAS